MKLIHIEHTHIFHQSMMDHVLEINILDVDFCVGVRTHVRLMYTFTQFVFFQSDFVVRCFRSSTLFLIYFLIRCFSIFILHSSDHSNPLSICIFVCFKVSNHCCMCKKFSDQDRENFSKSSVNKFI